MNKNIENEIVYLTKQCNHITSEIVKTKELIKNFGDNENFIKYLSSLENQKYCLNQQIYNLLLNM